MISRVGLVTGVLAGLWSTALVQAQSLRMYAEGPLEYSILEGDDLYGQVLVRAWGPKWSFFSFAGKPTMDAQGRRVVESQGKIGGTDVTLACKHTGAQTGDNQVTLTYELKAPADAKLTQVAASLVPGKAFAGQTCVLTMSDGTTKEIKLPFARGDLGSAVQSLKFHDRGGKDLTVRIAPPRPMSCDGEGRIQFVGDSIAADEARATTLTFEFPQPVKFFAKDEESLQRDDTAGWFAYPTGPAGVPVDLSFLNKDEKGNFVPAGSHGFLTVQDGEFKFEDGTPARFWGVNLTAGAVLGSEDRAKQLAERLSRLGVNVVRMHHLDSWASPIVDYKNADGTTQHLNPKSLHLLDRAVYELKQHGIYVVLDCWVQRCFKPGDGVDPYPNLGKQSNFGLHPYIYFDPRMQELIQKQWHDVWTHVNEFTNVAYKDEPACAMTEVINEGLLASLNVPEGPYRDRLKAIYETWAKDNNGLPWDKAKVTEQNWGDNNIRFMKYIQETFYKKSHDYFRSIGVKIPINSTNWAHFTWIAAAQTGGDFMDHHHYYGGDQVGPGSGLGGLWIEHSPTLGETPFGKMAAFAAPGKPVASSECGNCPPKTYRAAYMVGLAAAAAFQNWGSLTGFAYSQSPGPADKLSDFEWEADPASVASLAVGALIYRRGDVARAKDTVVVNVPEKELYNLRYGENENKQLWNLAALNANIEEHKVLVCFPGMEAKGVKPVETYDVESAAAYKHPNTELKSDTGELWRDWKIGVATIDTLRTQVAYGKLGTSKQPWKTRDCTFEIATPFAVTALSSLDGAPIASSKKLLLTAAARAENTGMTFNLCRHRVVQGGKAPVIAEPVVGTITLKTALSALTLYPLKVDGTRGPGVKLAAANGLVNIPLKAEDQTVFYELESADK